MAYRRPLVVADRCFVWLRDVDGVLLHGLRVDGAGDEREQAARAWLHVLQHRLRDDILSESAVFYVFADGRKTSVPLKTLRDWLEAVSSPREQTLKHEIRAALARHPTELGMRPSGRRAG